VSIYFSSLLVLEATRNRGEEQKKDSLGLESLVSRVVGRHKVDDDDLLDLFQTLCHRLELVGVVVNLSVVMNRVHRENDLWLDLSEPLQHTLKDTNEKRPIHKMSDKGSWSGIQGSVVEEEGKRRRGRLTATPKSGEVELQIAPMLCTASKITTASMQLLM